MKDNNIFELSYKSEKNAEQSLWKAVILQAFTDLKHKSKKKIANTYRVKAILWFNMSNENFITTCNYAGLDPRYVWLKAEDIKEYLF
ncbi:MAG: hypothetical protein LBS34_00845 [Rickettsiales bacterium]|jgi:hypothetical protein|nr:hypothetical protein [Rickettsiales bacterium]